MRTGVLAVALALPLILSGQQQPAQNQNVPDAPTPQSGGDNLRTLTSGVAPGEGAPPAAPNAANPDTSSPDETGPASSADQEPPPDTTVQKTPPVVEPQGETENAPPTFVANVNFVQVPVIVLDKKDREVAGLHWQDFQIYENNVKQNIIWFSSDAAALSVTLVIDQSLTEDVMRKVNESLSAVQGAFTPADAIAVFTYSNGVNEATTFTAAEGARLPAVLMASKAPGEQMGVPINSGPFTLGPQINGQSVDPNLDPGGSAGGGPFIVVPKEVHTLNDAILAAARALSTQPKERRRIIYVISDGKESRSKASYKDVVRYLQSNQIAVYGTLVGDSATWGLGYLDKFKLPLLPLSPDNILPKYADATGGHLTSEFSENGIQRSFAQLAALARTQYTLGFDSHLPVLDSRYRKLEVRVLRPGLEVHAPRGYYPEASAILH